MIDDEILKETLLELAEQHALRVISVCKLGCTGHILSVFVGGELVNKGKFAFDLKQYAMGVTRPSILVDVICKDDMSYDAWSGMIEEIQQTTWIMDYEDIGKFVNVS